MNKLKFISVIMAGMLLFSACQSQQTIAVQEPATTAEASSTESTATEVAAGENETPVSSESSESAAEEVGQTTENKQTENTDASSDMAFPVRDKKIPGYELELMDGSVIKLDQYEGKVVILTFFTTWCTYCEKEIPALQKRFEESEDLMVIGVDVRETEKELTPYLEKHGVTFPVVMDEDGYLAQLFYVTGFPTAVFISPEGVLVGSVPGYLEEEQMTAYIDYTRTYQPAELE